MSDKKGSPIKKITFTKREFIHAAIFGGLCVGLLFIIHHLPINQLFIDPFSEAIKNHDIMDVSLSTFRDHKDPDLFDENVFIMNSEVTNRADIAEVIHFLTHQEVGAIGVDLVFDSLEHGATDSLLLHAISNNKVVIGYSFDEPQELYKDAVIGIRSNPFFTEHANEGYVNLASDDGFSVRAFEPFYKLEGEERISMPLKLCELVDPGTTSILKRRKNKKEWINFRRKQPGLVNMQFPINENKQVHYPFTTVREFLKDKEAYGKSFFKDKIVMIGFCGEKDNALSMKDRYFTPLNEKYNGRSLPDMHGVVIQANIISMIRNNDYIFEISESILYLVAFLIFFFNYLIFTLLARRKLFLLMPIIRGIQVLQFIFLFTICVVMIAFYNVKIGFILIITSVVLSFELYEFYAHKLRNGIAQKINKIVDKK